MTARLPGTTRVDVQVRSEAIRRHELAAAGCAAAARWHEFGVPNEEAQALAGEAGAGGD